MAFTRRRDGIYLKELPAFRRIFPYLMPTRSESIIFFDQKIDMSRTLAYLETLNAERSREERVTLFHVFLAAIARTLKMRPELNRFVAGRRIYEHVDISATFIVKKALTEEAPESEARVVFSGEESLDEVRAKVSRDVRAARSANRGDDDKLVELVASFPRPIINLIAWLIRTLDYHSLLPALLMKAIPLYTSVYITNVGSIGLEAPYHHLFEIGSASLFVAIGKMHKEALVTDEEEIVVRDCVNLTFTLDERITEGFYCARSLLLFKKLVEEPELIDAKATALDAILD